MIFKFKIYHLIMCALPDPRKFKETLEKNVLNPPWPSHIPAHCPECHTSMNSKVNLFPTRSKLAHRIRAFAPWLSFVILFSTLVFLYFAPHTVLNPRDRGTPIFFVVMIVCPPLILTVMANCIPKVAKLQCHHCNFSKNFPQKPRPLSPDPSTNHQA
jgi:hypothetical protein